MKKTFLLLFLLIVFSFGVKNVFASTCHTGVGQSAQCHWDIDHYICNTNYESYDCMIPDTSGCGTCERGSAYLDAAYCNISPDELSCDVTTSDQADCQCCHPACVGPTPTPGGPTSGPGGCGAGSCNGCLGQVCGCNADCSACPCPASCSDFNLNGYKVMMPRGTRTEPASSQTMTWYDGTHRTTTANPFDFSVWGGYQRLPVCYHTTFYITVPTGYRVESVLTGGDVAPGTEIQQGNSRSRDPKSWEGTYDLIWRYYPDSMTCDLLPSTSHFTALPTIPPSIRLYQLKSGVTTGKMRVVGNVNGSLDPSNLQVYYARATPPFVWDSPKTTPPVFNPKQNNFEAKIVDGGYSSKAAEITLGSVAGEWGRLGSIYQGRYADTPNLNDPSNFAGRTMVYGGCYKTSPGAKLQFQLAVKEHNQAINTYYDGIANLESPDWTCTQKSIYIPPDAEIMDLSAMAVGINPSGGGEKVLVDNLVIARDFGGGALGPNLLTNWDFDSEPLTQHWHTWFHAATVSSNFVTTFDPSGLPGGDYEIVCNNALPANNAIRCSGGYDTTVIVNEASTRNCDAICADIGRACTNVGTDANATNGREWSTRCSDLASDCTVGMASGGRNCSGHTGMWTNCHCDTLGWQDCGAKSRIVVRIVSPTPIIGQIGVSFFEGQSLSSCTDTGRVLPAEAASFSTTSCPSPFPMGTSVCSQSGSGNINTTTTLGNLFVNPTPGSTTSYTTTLSALPLNWLKCDPLSGGLSTTFAANTTPTPANPLRFGITQNVGSWYQTLGGNVHGQTGNQTWSTPKSVVPPNPLNFFNISDPTRSIGLVSAHGTITCSDSMGGADTSCHNGATDWRSATDYSITSDETSNPTTYEDFDKLFPSKTDGGAIINTGTISNPNQYGSDDTYLVSGDLTFTGNDITINNKLIIFVTGSVDINANIYLGPNGFLAVFASGSINVNVVNPNRTNSIAGIFLSDTTFTADGISDIPLTVNGTVIASSVDNTRTFEDLALSQSKATVQFAFNPLLIINMPDALKHDASFSWKEVTR